MACLLRGLNRNSEFYALAGLGATQFPIFTFGRTAAPLLEHIAFNWQTSFNFG
jgi:hypothetical protein